MDYLGQIRRARKPETIAMLIRAFACRIMGSRLRTRDAETLEALRTYEDQAQTVERFGHVGHFGQRSDAVREIRKLLRQWGYY